MAWLPACGFRFWRRRRGLSAVALSTTSPPAEDQARPDTGSTAVAITRGTDTTPSTMITATTARRRLLRLPLPEALSSALRPRSSRPSSQRQHRNPEKEIISKKTDATSKSGKDDGPPRLDLDTKMGKVAKLKLFDENKKGGWKGNKDNAKVADDGCELSHRGTTKRINSDEWPDTPATAVSSSEEEQKSRIVEDTILAKDNRNRDSKHKDEVAVEDPEEEKRKRKMQEARLKAEQEEQERRDFLQWM